MPTALLTFSAAGLLTIQGAMGNPHRVWKEVAAQRIWSEHGSVVKDHLQLGRSPRGRAQLQFWMQRRGTIEPLLNVARSPSGHARVWFTSTADTTVTVVAAAFAVASGRDGVHVRSLGSAVVTSSEAAEPVRTSDAELWVTVGGAVALRANPAR